MKNFSYFTEKVEIIQWKAPFPFLLSQISIPYFILFLSFYFHFQIFAYHPVYTVHTVGDGCACCGQSRRREVSSAEGCRREMLSEDSASLSSCLCHHMLPNSLFCTKPLLLALTPTCCSCSLTAHLSDAGLPLALSATWLNLTPSGSCTHHMTEIAFSKVARDWNARSMAFPQTSPPTASLHDQTLISLYSCSALSRLSDTTSPLHGGPLYHIWRPGEGIWGGEGLGNEGDGRAGWQSPVERQEPGLRCTGIQGLLLSYLDFFGFSLILWIVNSSRNVLCVCLRNKRKQVSDQILFSRPVIWMK